MDKKIELKVVALSHSVTQSSNYAVVLGEKYGERRMPIVIGAYEAQAIAVALEKMVPHRPLTHDLFRNTLDVFGIEIKEIVINNLMDGIFYSNIVCQQEDKIINIDSRTSDAIAMAVRFNAPIFTFDSILEDAGVIIEKAEDEKAGKKVRKSKPETKKSIRLEDMEYGSLKAMLDKALEKEDYEKAAIIRDEMNKKKSSAEEE